MLRTINGVCYGLGMGSHHVSLPIIGNVEFDH